MLLVDRQLIKNANAIVQSSALKPVVYNFFGQVMEGADYSSGQIKGDLICVTSN